MVWLYTIGIIVTLWFSVASMPWRWLQDCTVRGSLLVGGWCLRHAPRRWQIAWQTLRYPEHRITAIFLLLVLGSGYFSGVAGQFHSIVVSVIVLIGVVLISPFLRAHRAFQQRQTRVIAALPAQLDLLAMLLVAGQPLLNSLQQSSHSGIDNPLREELRKIVSQIRAGVAVDAAFELLAAHYPCREVRIFCSALHHARESGAGLAGILYEQAEQRRQELFLQAEKKATEAPVKLMFPLLLFIFPGTILVLVVTLAAKMMWNL